MYEGHSFVSTAHTPNNCAQAFLTTLRDTYADLQAKENLLITMEGMQELEPVNADELAFLEAEAAATRTQVL